MTPTNLSHIDAAMTAPVFVRAMDKIANELSVPPATHSHSTRHRRPWWARIKFYRWGVGIVDRFYVRHHSCQGVLTAKLGSYPKIRTEWEADTISWRLVGFRSWRCLAPCVPGSEDTIQYVGVRIKERELMDA